MAQQLEVEGVIRRYLLGELPEEDQAEVEDRLVTDRQYFNQLLIAENELADDYVQGSLSVEDKERVMTYFLAVPERREKLRFAQALNAYVSETEHLSEEEPGSAPASTKGNWLYSRLRRLVDPRPSRQRVERTLPDDLVPIENKSALTWEYLLAEAKSNRDLLSSLSDSDWLGLRLLGQLRADSLLDVEKLAYSVGATSDVVTPLLSRLLRLGLLDEDGGLFFCTEVGVEMIERAEKTFGVSLKL